MNQVSVARKLLLLKEFEKINGVGMNLECIGDPVNSSNVKCQTQVKPQTDVSLMHKYRLNKPDGANCSSSRFKITEKIF